MSNLSIPINIQYHFLKKHRIHPFVGVGTLYNINIPGTKNISSERPDYISNMEEPGLKYVNIVFTQGVIFEVNTKIHITQSFHFMPNSNLKTLGLSLGVEFTLP